MKKQKKYIKSVIIIFIFLFILYLSFNKNLIISFSFIKDLIYNEIDYNNKNDIIGTNINNELINEINDLKKLLSINNTLTDYDKINAVVIERHNNNWINKITINKGKKDGIEVGDAVVVSEGFVGYIDSITNSTSIVKLLLSNDLKNKISVKIINNGEYIYKVLEYDSEELKIKNIDKSIQISEDCKILTSGLSDKYPAGITIGKLKKIENDKYNLNQTIIIESLVDFNNLNFVTVVGRKI